MLPFRSDRSHVQAASRPLWPRLAWFAGIWTASVLALGAVGYAIRVVLN